MLFPFVFNAVKFLIIMESQRAVWMCGRMLGNQNRIVQQALPCYITIRVMKDGRRGWRERIVRQNKQIKEKETQKVLIIQEGLPEINYSKIKHI